MKYRLTIEIPRQAFCPGCSTELHPDGWMVFMSLAFCSPCLTTLPTERIIELAQHVYKEQTDLSMIYTGGILFWCPVKVTAPRRSIDLIARNPSTS